MTNEQNNEKNDNFRNIGKLNEFARQQIIDDAELAVQNVNTQTQRSIQAALESEASGAVAQAISDAGRITARQRAQIIDKVHRQYKVHFYAEGGK